MNRDLWKEIAWMVAVVVMLILFIIAWINHSTSDMIAAGILAVLCDGRLFKRSVWNNAQKGGKNDE